MSVNTNAILFGIHTVQEVAEVLKTLRPEVGEILIDMHEGYAGTSYGYLTFKSIDPPAKWPDNRWMGVHPGISDYPEIYDGKRTVLTLGCNEEAKEIMHLLASHFGGYVMPNDCEDEVVLVESTTQVELDPKSQLKIALSKMVGAKRGAEISRVIDDPVAFERMMEAFDTYRAAIDTAPSLRP